MLYLTTYCYFFLHSSIFYLFKTKYAGYVDENNRFPFLKLAVLKHDSKPTTLYPQ